MNVDSVVQQIYQNLVRADHIMNQSWRDYPANTDPKVDALRKRIQNMIDLQRALANRYEQFAGIYLDNEGNASLLPPGQRTYFKAQLRALVFGQAHALAYAANSGSVVRTEKDASGIARYGDTGQIISQLRAQERAFLPEVLTANGSCKD